MGLLDDYLKRADELIGDRSDGEKAYDDAVLEALGSGKGIAAAIEQANAAFPDEALAVNDDNLENVEAHYEYLLEHARIMTKMGGRAPGKKAKGRRKTARKKKRKKRR